MITFFRNFILLVLLLTFTILSGCKDQTWNNPHQKTAANANIRYASFNESPKTLDPALSYSTDESIFVSQIYEPPLQYHYLIRPYTLIPLTAAQMPQVTYLNAQGQPLPANAPDNAVAFSRYDIQIKPGIFYQPHPAFAKDANGNWLYHHLTAKDLKHIHQLKDFKNTGTRELTADDYVYEIKRLAHPQLNSPISGLMTGYIVGLKDYTNILQKAYVQTIPGKNNNTFFDLRQYPLSGAQVTGRYSYEIIIYGKYPQFIYWLAMSFFAPVPWEADEFYSQPGMKQRNITFNWYPVGTGAYMMTENNPNREMVLTKNPNFHGELYPSEGMPGDQEKGLLAMAGKPLPLIDQYIFSLEKESIPRWNKFLQGYYDASLIGSDSYDQAIAIDANGNPVLTSEMRAKDIQLQTSVSPGIFYFGFNMLDDVVGGYSERARKLRQAISIALNIEDFISIFLNGRGVPAQGPIPEGIFGYLPGAAGINPYVYTWHNNKPERLPLAYAKKLLVEAGYPNGRDIKTGKPLVLNYDVPLTNSPDSKSQFDWMRQQFAELGIQLNIRGTQYNRFQEKMRSGNTQIYFWGWSADYPDPEDFLFLLYGSNSMTKTGGENASNYQNPAFDQLFLQMKMLPNGPQRQQVINQMLAIVRQDSPWIWGFNTQDFMLTQSWVCPTKLDALGYNTLKYQCINPVLRTEKQKEWNQPKLWPLGLSILILFIGALPVIINYWRQQHSPRIKRMDDI